MTRMAPVALMPARIIASSQGETPEMARNLAASEAPRSAWPNGISMADAVQDAKAIVTIKLGPASAHFY